MSGYLERLASSAVQPGGSIHPVLGSVFSAPKYGRSSDELPLEEVDDSRDQPGSLMTPGPERPRASRDPETASDRSDSPIPHHPFPPLRPDKSRRNPDANAIPEQGTPLKPLVIEVRQQEVDRPVFRADSEDDQAGKSPKLIEQAGRGRDQGAILRSGYTPIMPEMVPGTAAPSNFGDKSTLFPPAAGTRAKGVVSRGGVGLRAERPDEIQIHIGRIEVTAVPPAPVPPAARPATKSVSLDEYLKRRDARAL